MTRTGISVRTRATTDESDSVTVQTLVPGEGIAYKITHEVALEDGTKMWVSFGSSTEVRPGENDQIASQRLVNFVHSQVEDAIRSAANSAQNMSL